MDELTKAELIETQEALIERAASLMGGKLSFALASAGEKKRSKDEVLAYAIEVVESCVGALGKVQDEMRKYNIKPRDRALKDLRRDLEKLRKGEQLLGPLPHATSSI